MRVLDAVVEPPSCLLFFERAHFGKRSLMGSESIHHDLFYKAMVLHQFLEKFQCSLLISTFGDNSFQHFAFVIRSPTKIVPLAIHLHENIVQVPLPFRGRAQLLHTLSSKLSSKLRAKPVLPTADSFAAYVDASLVQQIFIMPKREREPNIKHLRQADDLGAGFEVFEGGRLGHP